MRRSTACQFRCDGQSLWNRLASGLTQRPGRGQSTQLSLDRDAARALKVGGPEVKLNRSPIRAKAAGQPAGHAGQTSARVLPQEPQYCWPGSAFAPHCGHASWIVIVSETSRVFDPGCTPR
jgi:hypothetical protein